MFDFKLNQKGDLMLAPRVPISSFNLTFGVSRFATQRISFTTIIKPKKARAHQQNISFYFKNKDDLVMAEKDVRDTEELLQAIRIAMKTEKQDTYNYNVGSTFFALNHTVYKEEEDLEPIRNKIQEIASQYFPSCVIVVSFEDTEGYFWCQNIVAKLYDKDKLLTKFII